MMTDEQLAYHVLKLVTQKILHNQDTLLLPIAYVFLILASSEKPCQLTESDTILCREGLLPQDRESCRKKIPAAGRIIT